MENNLETEIQLNYKMFKERSIELAKTNRTLLKLIIKSSPREVVIEILKELKILKIDLNLQTDKVELMEK